VAQHLLTSKLLMKKSADFGGYGRPSKTQKHSGELEVDA
jgi:hypothetical protein